MRIRNAVIAGAMMALSAVAVNAKPEKGYFTFDAMGCMLPQECTEGVTEVHSLLDVSSQYENPERYTFAALEFNNMLNSQTLNFVSLLKDL